MAKCFVGGGIRQKEKLETISKSSGSSYINVTLDPAIKYKLFVMGAVGNVIVIYIHNGVIEQEYMDAGTPGAFGSLTITSITPTRISISQEYYQAISYNLAAVK